MITITQDVEDFLAQDIGKAIVTNSALKFLLKQSPAAIDKVGDVFKLSEGEKQLLLAADVGEGIFFAGPNHVAIRVVASEKEYKLITTKPEDVLAARRQSLDQSFKNIGPQTKEETTQNRQGMVVEEI